LQCLFIAVNSNTGYYLSITNEKYIATTGLIKRSYTYQHRLSQSLDQTNTEKVKGSLIRSSHIYFILREKSKILLPAQDLLQVTKTTCCWAFPVYTVCRCHKLQLACLFCFAVLLCSELCE